jgi:hypothetical protein
VGYPRLAAFQSSEGSFSIYRSFDYLHSRVILTRQEELRDLESQLNILDGQDSKKNPRRLSSGRKAGPERTKLLSTIGDKLVEYDDLLMKARDLNAFQRPSDRDYHSLRNWYYRRSPLVAREGEFVKRREDLITLRQGREWAGFDGLIESSIKRLPFGMSVCSPHLTEYFISSLLGLTRSSDGSQQMS